MEAEITHSAHPEGGADLNSRPSASQGQSPGMWMVLGVRRESAALPLNRSKLVDITGKCSPVEDTWYNSQGKKVHGRLFPVMFSIMRVR